MDKNLGIHRIFDSFEEFRYRKVMGFSLENLVPDTGDYFENVVIRPKCCVWRLNHKLIP